MESFSLEIIDTEETLNYSVSSEVGIEGDLSNNKTPRRFYPRQDLTTEL